MSEHILVVEDDDAIAAFIATALEREGYGIAWVRTGQEAMSHVRSSPPDLMLLDLMLPGDMDGLRVCQAIRRGEAYIPVIIVTAKDEDVDKVVGLELACRRLYHQAVQHPGVASPGACRIKAGSQRERDAASRAGEDRGAVADWPAGY